MVASAVAVAAGTTEPGAIAEAVAAGPPEPGALAVPLAPTAGVPDAVVAPAALGDGFAVFVPPLHAVPSSSAQHSAAAGVLQRLIPIPSATTLSASVAERAAVA